MTQQLSLFTGDVDPAVRSDARAPAASPHPPSLRALGRRLPRQLYLGTSSWSFPGWAGSVYDTPYDATLLAQSGLPAYAAHPLFRTVSIDRTYYAPIAREAYARYAEQVPEDFRFIVKAPSASTAAVLRSDDGRRLDENVHYLDAGWIRRNFVEPATEGLGSRCGPLLLQFPPQGRAITSRPRAFAARLAAFLEALPRGPEYAVELRDVDLWTDDFVSVLREHGVRLCIGIHPRAPSLPVQQATAAALVDGALIVRWNLNPRHRYEEAKARYAPFDRLVEPDATTRETISTLAREGLAAGREVFVVANNKAEGSAPATIMEIARAVVRR